MSVPHWTLRVVTWLFASCLLVSLGSAAAASQQSSDQEMCPVTKPNGIAMLGESGPNQHGNGKIFTALWAKGVVEFKPGGSGFVLSDGSLEMKWPWWHAVPGDLRIEGRRLDGPAPPLRSTVPCCYSGSFQSSGLIFPVPGCWEVTGRVGDAKLTFVTRVVRIGTGPIQNRAP
jgi:hypothetical protein